MSAEPSRSTPTATPPTLTPITTFPGPMPVAPRWLLLAGLVVATAIALWLRTTNAADVFTQAGVRLVFDGDPYYHARRAWEIVQGHGVLWRDPMLNYPVGADVPWPPLFDAVLAWTAMAVSGGAPTREQFLAISAWVPVVLGTLGVLATAGLASELVGVTGAVVTALALASFPAAAHFGMLGRPDQHVLEFLLFVLILLAFARAQRGRGILAAVSLGVLLTLAFWTWPGTPIVVAFLLASAAGWRIVASPDDPSATVPARAVAVAGAVASVLLVASIPFLGAPGALTRLTLGGISGFAPLVSVALAGAGMALMLPTRAATVAGRAARVVGGGALLGGAALVALPAARAVALAGMTAVAGARPFFSHILEFQPSLFSGNIPLELEVRALLKGYGVAPLLLIPAGLELWRRWKVDASSRPVVFFVAVLGLFYVSATALARRFGLYGAVPLAFGTYLGLVWVWRNLPRPLAGTVGTLCVLGLLAPLALHPRDRFLSTWRDGALDVSARLRERDGAPGAVLAFWQLGHHVLWEAGRPVLASPFGTEGGDGAWNDFAEFYLDRDPARAEALLASRGVRYLLLGEPLNDVTSLSLDAPDRAPVRFEAAGWNGRHALPAEGFADLTIARLFAGFGAATQRATALGTYRLVDESDRSAPRDRLRLFERVSGAVLAVDGATPGSRVTAQARLTRPDRLATGTWTAAAVADAAGRAQLRVPYATGMNGRVSAEPWDVSDGDAAVRVSTAESDVELGHAIAVSLGKRASRRAGEPTRLAD